MVRAPDENDPFNEFDTPVPLGPRPVPVETAMTFTKGEHVFVTLGGRTSPKRSWALVTARGNIGAVMFDDAILGGYVGLMPVFEPADGADPSRA